VTLRPSPWLPTGHLILGVLYLLLAGAGLWLRLIALPVVLAALAVAHLVLSLMTATGRVELSPDGVRVRGFGQSMSVPWAGVAQFVVRTTWFGRHVQLRRTAARPVRLPAPAASRLLPAARFDEDLDQLRAWCASQSREVAAPVPERRRLRWAPVAAAVVLLAVAALVDRPWGWVAGAEAATIPDACTAVQSQAAELARQMPPEPLASTSLTGPDEVHACGWQLDGERGLGVFIGRFGRSGLHSGTSVAARYFSSQRLVKEDLSSGEQDPRRRAIQLGDVAELSYIGLPSSTRGYPGVAVAARRANVVVLVSVVPVRLQGDSPAVEDRDVDKVVAIARAAVDAIELR
jgi:hypothetical protein